MKYWCEAHHRQHFSSLGIPEEFHPREIDISEEEYAAVFSACKHSDPKADGEALHTKTLGVLASRQHASAPVGADIPQHLKDESQQNEFTKMRHHLREMSKERLPDLKKELDDIEEAVKSGNLELSHSRTEIGAAIAAASGAIVGALNMNQSGIEKIAEDMRLDRAEDRHLFKQFGWGILTLLFLLIVATLFAPRAHGQFSHINSIQFQQDGTNVTGGFFSYPFTINCTVNVTCTIVGGKLVINSAGGGSGSPCVTDALSLQFNNAGSFGCVTGSSVSGGSVTLGSPIFQADGAVGAPSYSFKNAPGTGMYKSAGGSLVFTMAGSQLLAMSSGVTTTSSLVFSNSGWQNLTAGASGGLLLGSGHCIKWNSVASSGNGFTGDSTLCRSGAASFTFGNDTAGDFSGTIKATTINAVTGFQVNGSALNFSNLAGTATSTQVPLAASATVLATTRAIYGNNFDGSAALTQIIASTFGGTGNGFTKFSGPATAEKTFTLPNASAAILTDNAAVTVAQGGTGTGSTLTGVVRGGSPLTAAELSGDATTSGSNAVTVAKVNGVTYAASPSTDTSPIITASNTATYTAINNCGDSSHALSYNTSTHAYGCQSITGSAAAGGSDTQMQYNDATALNGASNFLYTKASGLITANQKADTSETIKGKRFTDTTPTGDFLYFTNAAANADIARLDVNGVLTLGAAQTHYFQVAAASQSADRALTFPDSSFTAGAIRTDASGAVTYPGETGSSTFVRSTTPTIATPVLNHPTIGISGTSASAHILTVGTAPTCAFSTGGGTSPSCALETGSTDMAGTMTLTTGSGSPGSAGTITLTFNATMGTNSPVCIAGLTKGATDWSVSSVVRVTTQSTTAPVFSWSSQSATALVALTASTNYKMTYICIAK